MKKSREFCIPYKNSLCDVWNVTGVFAHSSKQDMWSIWFVHLYQDIHILNYCLLLVIFNKLSFLLVQCTSVYTFDIRTVFPRSLSCSYRERALYYISPSFKFVSEFAIPLTDATNLHGLPKPPRRSYILDDVNAQHVLIMLLKFFLRLYIYLKMANFWNCQVQQNFQNVCFIFS